MKSILSIISFGLLFFLFSCEETPEIELKTDDVRDLENEASTDKKGIILKINPITDTITIGDTVRFEIDVSNYAQKGELSITGVSPNIDSVRILGNKISVLRKATSIRDSLFSGTVYLKNGRRTISEADFSIPYHVRDLRIELSNLTSSEYVLNQRHKLSLEVERHTDFYLIGSGGTIYKVSNNWEFTPTSLKNVELTLVGKGPQGKSFVLKKWDIEVIEK